MRRRKRMMEDLEQDIREHIEIETQDNIARGMSPEEARRAAFLKFGNVTKVKEQTREVWSLVWLEQLLQDLRFALRMLRKSPGFTAVAVLTLALGIGANAAIFSVLEAQIWKSLPFPDSNRLVNVLRTSTTGPNHASLFAAPDFPDWTAAAQNTFGSICAFQWPDFYNMPGTDTAERVTAQPVSSTFFDTLRMPPVLGRSFLPSEQRDGSNHEVILSYAFWQSHYNSDPRIVGSTLVLDGSPYTIVGIAPAGLDFGLFGDNSNMYVPLVITHRNIVSRTGTGLLVVARLKQEVSLRSAQAQMDVIANQLARENPERDANHGLRIRQMRGAFAGEHQGLFFFAGAVVLILLIACANVASLLLARGLARQHEFALRAALGAGRCALLRQLLVEGVLVGALGGALGIFAALWGANTLNALLPQDFLNSNAMPQMDARVLAFAIAISFGAAILSALVPGLFASRVDLNDALRNSGYSSSSPSGHRRLRSAFVIAEVTMSVVLLFGAGLFLNSFVRQVKAPLGFDPHKLLSVGLTLSDKRYTQPQNLWLAEQQILQRVRAVPGVTDAAFASQIPFAGGIGADFEVVGHPTSPNAEKPYALFSSVTTNYFQLFKIPLLAGRSFDLDDSQNSPFVAVINENFVQHYFGGRNPLGAELEVFGNGFGHLNESVRLRIIGVVQNTQYLGANEVPFDYMYVSSAQVPLISFNSSAFLVASTNLPPSAVVGPIRHQIAQVDRDIPVTHVATMEQRVSHSLQDASGDLILIGVFAALAVALVAVGIFGAIAYFVEQRTREFGIRLALGASPARILRHALKQSAVLGVSGLALGIGVSFILGRLLGSALYLVPREHDGLLYGVNIFDPLTLAAACVLLASVLLVASYIPARRATRVDPMVALRYE